MQSDGTDRSQATQRPFLSSLVLTAIAIALCAALYGLAVDPWLPLQPPTAFPRYLAYTQDFPIAIIMVAMFVLLARIEARPRLLALRPSLAIGVVTAMAVAAAVIRMFALWDFDLTRDEQMVGFDAAIYAKGMVFAPFPPAWREWYGALNLAFLLPVGDRDGWVSNYLPGNAAIHALLGQFIPPALVCPLLLLVAGFALWRITRRIWPDSPGTQAVVLLLFAGSSQAIVMAATRYAMTAHLTLNLCWLWLFLQRRPAAHAGAIAVGFVATGLHQVLFHPVFVLPFLDLLRRERNWRLLSVYVAAYGAIGLFWLAWSPWVSGLGAHPVPADLHLDGVSHLDRIRTVLDAPSTLSLGLMGINLLRFIAWQHLLLVPLLFMGLRAAFRADPVCRALTLGIMLLLAAMLLLMPAQSHGWGYRYMHGFLGSAVLIAGFGWRKLERDGMAPAQPFLLATALSLLVLLPLHVSMTRKVVAPYATGSAALARIPADVVIVEDDDLPFGTDFVRNRPDLSNRPIMLKASLVPPSSLTRLCAGGRTLALADTSFFAPVYRLTNMPVPTRPGAKQQRLHDAAREAGCRTVPAR